METHPGLNPECKHRRIHDRSKSTQAQVAENLTWKCQEGPGVSAKLAGGRGRGRGGGVVTDSAGGVGVPELASGIVDLDWFGEGAILVDAQLLFG